MTCGLREEEHDVGFGYTNRRRQHNVGDSTARHSVPPYRPLTTLRPRTKAHWERVWEFDRTGALSVTHLEGSQVERELWTAPRKRAQTVEGRGGKFADVHRIQTAGNSMFQ